MYNDIYDVAHFNIIRAFVLCAQNWLSLQHLMQTLYVQQTGSCSSCIQHNAK